MKKRKPESVPQSVYFAIIVLFLITAFVTVNTILLSRTIGRLEEKANAMPLEAVCAEELYAEFLRVRTYLALTVDHDDIASVEEELAELRGALAIGDTESAAIAKSRLFGALGHLRRLSGFNIDSII